MALTKVSRGLLSTSIEDNGNATAITIDSSEKVGIGTSSPTVNLDIQDSSQAVVKVGDGSTVDMRMVADVASGVGSIRTSGSTSVMAMYTGGSERLRIDSSGNVGINTSSPQKTLDVKGTFAISNSTTSYWDFDRDDSDGSLKIADTGTERMRLDSSGNVGIGTSSPMALLDVESATGNVGFNYGTSSSPERANLWYDTDGSGWKFNIGKVQSGSFTSQMTIQDNGNVGIGTTSPTAPLQVSGSVNGIHEVNITNTFDDNDGTGDNPSSRLYLGAASNNAYIRCHGAPENAASNHKVDIGSTAGSSFLTFSPSGSERMRLDSSGHLLVGTTSSTPTGGGFAFRSGTVGHFRTSHASGTASGNWYQAFYLGASVIGTITQSGTTGVNYNTSSDQRLKENIADADDAGSKIDAIQVRQYDWKADGSHQDYGMIAQELVEVAPEAVTVPADSEEMMGVDYSKLVPMLIKEIQSLRNRVAQLEE